MSLDLDDIQGNILRGYNASHARHFALAGQDHAKTARFIEALLPSGHHGLHISTAAKWASKPAYCLNLSLTADGLSHLGVPPATLGLFPDTFRQGAARRAAIIGDTGSSAPEHWVLGGTDTPAVHMVLSLYTHAAERHTFEHHSQHLRTLFKEFGLQEISCHDAEALPEGQVHFGYRDGISQPRIEGMHGRELTDMQPASTPGEFLLGSDHVNQFAGNWIGDLPAELCTNATYAALRIMKQDVDAFETFLDLASKRYGMDREWVAAKLMGRWRNGTPLTLSPDTDQPAPPIPPSRLNDFNYAPTAGHPTYFDDREGLRCPVGSHIRRLNPRDALTMGKPHTRRLIRRGMPYGPAWTPEQRSDGQERGLIGYFICGDLEMQFEFLLHVWGNSDYATTGLRGTREPILGAQPDEGGKFVIRTDNGSDPIVLDNLPRLVTTRGCLYCLLPGISGLRFLARLGGGAGA